LLRAQISCYLWIKGDYCNYFSGWTPALPAVLLAGVSLWEKEGENAKSFSNEW
jgi:hypothetical protein